MKKRRLIKIFSLSKDNALVLSKVLNIGRTNKTNCHTLVSFSKLFQTDLVKGLNYFSQLNLGKFLNIFHIFPERNP